MLESNPEKYDPKCTDENSVISLIENGESVNLGGSCRKEKRKFLKKLKRKQIRKEIALKELAEEEAKLNDPEEQLKIRLKEQEEAEILERERKTFEEHERLFIEAARKAAEEAEEKRRLHEDQVQHENDLDKDDDFEYVEEGPAEIIWQGNEIIVKKKRIKVPKKKVDQQSSYEDDNRPTSNPLPPQSAAFEAYKTASVVSANAVFESVSQQTPNFGTEQDKAHCPFHIKTGACRFGARCSRVHFYPDRSCTLLIKNMYTGPGLAWEQDEGLEYMDEEVDHCYEEFYEDVHTEFLKFGEIINFKVCRNGSFHLRGNVYVHYKSLESAVLAYNSINGRYFAGKQMTCEFVGVTRWKIAICGEYMKSKLKSCSHGTACNFIHCFRNPGGDYEWADWDNPPPKYWVKKMAALFGTLEELSSEKHGELEYMEYQKKSRRKTAESDRYHSRRFSSAEHQNSDSGGDGARQNRNSNRTRYPEFSNEKIRNHDDRRSRGKECSGSQRSKQSVPVNEGKLKSEKLGSGDRKHRSRRSSSSEMDHRKADSNGDFSDRNDGAHRHSSRMVAHYSGSEFSDQITKDQHDRHSRRKKHKRDFPDDKGRFKSEKLATGDGSDGGYTRNRYPNDRNEEESDFGGSVHAECRSSGYHSEDSLENSGNVRHGHRQRSGNSTGSRDRSRQRNNKVESEIEGFETGYSKWDKRESRRRSKSQSSVHQSGHKRKKDSDDKHGEYSGRSGRETERSP